MKKIFKAFIAISSVVLVASGCNKLLDLAPIDYAAAGNYWKSAGEVENFMNGLHKNLRDDYTSQFILGETRGGTLKEGTSSVGTSLNYSALVLNNISALNPQISNWNGYYGKIFQVNHFISQVEGGCKFLSESSKSYYLGQAYGIRAYYYFMLYRTFGGVILEVDERLLGDWTLTDLYRVRSSAEETLKQIKDDIAASERNFGASTAIDRVMWSPYATQMLKADVYLWSAKVTTKCTEGDHTATNSKDEINTALQALQVIENSGKFDLMSSVEDLHAYKNKANKEIILAMHFAKDEATNSGFGDYFWSAVNLFIGNYFDEAGNKIEELPIEFGTTGLLRNEYREGFVTSMDKEDQRRSKLFYEYYTSADVATRAHGSALLKYLGHLEGTTRYIDNDVIYYRYADVILKIAECYNALDNGQKCAEYINKVRKRAYGANWDATFAYNAGTKAQNELALLRERDKEFVGEGKRWFDVLRMQDANGKPLVFSVDAAYPVGRNDQAAAILSSGDEHKLLWPINSAVLAADDKITQTFGY